MARRLRIVRTGRGVQTAYPAAAGTWRAAPAFTKLTRPASPGIETFRQMISVPIGNDGIARPVTFSAAGTALAVVGPSGIGASWQAAQANAYTSIGALDAAIAAVWLGPLAIAQYQVASGLNGGNFQVPLGGTTLVPGWFIFALWTGGTPGATAYLNVSGTKTALVQG